MYSEYTKAELIEIINERDNEIEELKQKYETLKSNYDEDSVTYEEMIDELQVEIKRIKNKYENTDFRKFMETYGDIAEKMQIDRIKEKYEQITGNRLTFNKIYQTLNEMGYKTTNSKKVGHHGYATKNKDGYLYLIQLDKERKDSIYKIGLTFDFVNRSNTYFKEYECDIIMYKIFHVSDMRKAESELKNVLQKNNIKTAHGDEYYNTDYETIERHYLDVVNQFNGIEENIDDIIARKKESKKHNFKIINGQTLL